MALFGLKFGVPRFRVRTLLVLVAVVAFALEGSREVLLWMRYSYRLRVSSSAALAYERAVAEWEDRATSFEKEALTATPRKAKALREQSEMAHQQSEGYRSLAIWAKGLAVKYEKARQTPWKAVPGDPPHRASQTMIGDPGW
jgi:cell division protein FtsL